jgi:hypothetical protein
MTNREWLLKEMQNMSDEDFCDLIQDCNLKEYGVVYDTSYGKCMCKWLEAEHKEKPKLSEAERVILENMDRTHKWIARDSSGWLHLYENKPDKNTSYMSWMPKYGSTRNFGLFNHLFQFIKWSDNEPYEIADLLKGE